MHAQDAFIHKLVEKKLAASGFCRGGWTEQARNFVPPDLAVHGVCKETATGIDRQNFPNADDGAR